MAYIKTDWIDNVTVVNAEKMNKIEEQLEYLDINKLDSDEISNLQTSLQNLINDKVDKETGKGLSTNDFTTEDKTKVESISGIQTTLQDLYSIKVNKVEGKDLSTHDFTTEHKATVESIDSLVSSIGASISDIEENKANKNVNVTLITETQGDIVLETNKIYRISINGNTTFILPSDVENTIFNQILIQATVTSDAEINWGTDLYLGDEYSSLGVGKYDIVFEYNGEH